MNFLLGPWVSRLCGWVGAKSYWEGVLEGGDSLARWKESSQPTFWGVKYARVNGGATRPERGSLAKRETEQPESGKPGGSGILRVSPHNVQAKVIHNPTGSGL